jgi:hypothetical protein
MLYATGLGGMIGITPALKPRGGMIGITPAEKPRGGMIGITPAEKPRGGMMGITPAENPRGGMMGITPASIPLGGIIGITPADNISGERGGMMGITPAFTPAGTLDANAIPQRPSTASITRLFLTIQTSVQGILVKTSAILTGINIALAIPRSQAISRITLNMLELVSYE